MDNASVWISDTTVEDKQGNLHPATYIALWLGVAVHSKKLWKEFYGDYDAAPSSDGDDRPTAPYQPLCTRAKEYHDPELFRQFRSAMLEDDEIELRTEYGLHMTMAYAGPMNETRKSRIQTECDNMLRELRRCQYVDPFTRVEKFLHLRRHWVKFGGIASEPKCVNLTEVETSRIDELLNSGCIDTTRYSDPQCDDYGDVGHQREKFAEWMRGAFSRKKKALIHAVLLESLDFDGAARKILRHDGTSYAENWRPIKYPERPYWTVWGSTAWEWGFYLKQLLHECFQQTDPDTNKNYRRSKKGHRIAPSS